MPEISGLGAPPVAICLLLPVVCVCVRERVTIAPLSHTHTHTTGNRQQWQQMAPLTRGCQASINPVASQTGPSIDTQETGPL